MTTTIFEQAKEYAKKVLEKKPESMLHHYGFEISEAWENGAESVLEDFYLLIMEKKKQGPAYAIAFKEIENEISKLMGHDVFEVDCPLKEK